MFHPLFTSFNLRRWPLLIQRIRMSGDATPAMLPIALVGTLGFSAGLLSRIPYAHFALIVLLSPWLAISMTGAALTMYDSLRRVCMDCLRGSFGSTQCFEFSRAVLILGVQILITTFTMAYFGISIIEFTGIPIATAFVLFSIGSLMGYMLARNQHQLPSSSYECVDFFFLQFLAAAAVAIPVILLSRIFDPLYVIAVTVILASTAAALFTLIGQQKPSQDTG